MRLLEATRADLPYNPLVLIPIGSIEQHGEHLPLGTDTIIASYIAERVAEKFENAITTPPIAITTSPEHLGFRGTISVNYETFFHYIREIIECIAGLNARGIVLINAHGGCAEVVELAVKDWNYKGRRPKALHYNIYNERVRNFALRLFKSMGHADSFETSLLAAIDERLVRWDRIGNAEAWGSLNIHTTVEISQIGVIGSLRKEDISVEKGRWVLEFIIDDLAKTIRSVFSE